MSVKEQVMHRVVEPAVVRFCQWRGDPVARLLRPAAKADPYPLYADLRRRGLDRSSLGIWATASHDTAASFRVWGHDVAATLDPQSAAESQSRASELALTAYLRDLVSKRRAHPDGSLLSALIGNGTVALLGERQDWRRLGEEPSLVPAAVEELLRYDSPVQMTSRTATGDVDVAGTAAAARAARL